MKEIILDFGSGNTCQNDLYYTKKMMDELKKIDTRKIEITIKWQLFQEAGKNIPLDWGIFDYAYNYGRDLGYQVTASVFDIISLNFLMRYNIPFIKIANNYKLMYLVGEIPRKYNIYISGNNISKNFLGNNIIQFACISKYPASYYDYVDNYNHDDMRYISDHTSDFNLFNILKPEKIEWHYKLNDSIGLDAGSFARTPEILKTIL